MKKPFGLLVIIFALILAATGCGGQNSPGTVTQTETSETQQQSQGQDYQDISPETLKEMMNTDKNLIVVDVREKVEWDEGHIRESQLIPISEFQSRVNELPKDKKIVLVCSSGSRSPQVAAYMIQLGYTQIYNLNRGLMYWPYEIVK